MEFKKIFNIVPTNEEKNDFVVIVGKHLATEQHFKSEEEAKEYMETPNWETLMAVVSEMMDIKDMKDKEAIKEDAKKLVNHIIEDTKES